MVFKTDISTATIAKELSPLFARHPAVLIWSVDITDVDNVLRIEASNTVTEIEIIKLVQSLGYFCVVLD
ncbi:MAG: hypothetical protein HRT73_14155 [Flavobacteriales bacterium]|nr:hypothetical protein [Flavobacteriales bacterium]NQX99001.1 hypothetical protein [Flavobacteriales bacterium]